MIHNHLQQCYDLIKKTTMPKKILLSQQYLSYKGYMYVRYLTTEMPYQSHIHLLSLPHPPASPLSPLRPAALMHVVRLL